MIKELFQALNSPYEIPQVPWPTNAPLPLAAQDLIDTSPYIVFDQVFKFKTARYRYESPTCIIFSFGQHVSPTTWKFIHVAINLLEKMHGPRQKMTIILGYSLQRKMLPTTNTLFVPLGPIHINSGVSVRTDRVCVIYRREEMQKVILHELLHLWCIDCSTDDDKDLHISKMFKIFSTETRINETLRIGEAYTDFYACVYMIALGCCKTTTITKTTKITTPTSFATFKKHYIANLKITRQHVYSVAANVVQYYANQKWIEHTHAFSYYVVKAVFFRHLIELQKWTTEQKSNNNHDKPLPFHDFITPILEKPGALAFLSQYASSEKSLRMMQKMNTT